MDDIAQKMVAERQALAVKPVSLPAFEKLVALECRRILSVGVNARVARAAWQGETVAGKVFGIFGGLLAIAIPFAFWFYGWLVGAANIVTFYLYHRIQVAISSGWLRSRVLEYPTVFHGLYCQGNLGIRVRGTGQHLMVPHDWMAAVEELSLQHGEHKPR
jgi:hypothetical protein